MSHASERGRLLEDIVAQLHQFADVHIDKRVRLPALSSPKRKREIDVLLTQEVAGYPVRIAIECKNEARVVGTERIDSFVGKLHDVGIPACHGIFVSSTGYTRGAIERAEKAGVRTLALEGLTPDRLGLAVNDALQFFAYMLATVVQYDRFENSPEPTQPDGPQWERLPAEFGDGIPAVNMFIWQLWVTGRISMSLGSHAVFVRLPKVFRFASEGPPFHDGLVIVTLSVTAHVARLVGTARVATLRDASTSRVEKILLEGHFPGEQGRLELDTIDSDEALQEIQESAPGRHILSGRIRVPRIIADSLFWPPSPDAVRRLLELRHRGEEISFGSVEGTDLGRAWELWATMEIPAKRT